jgi:hypothetical protein
MPSITTSFSTKIAGAQDLTPEKPASACRRMVDSPSLANNKFVYF